jgi:hypothetical protein
MGGERSINLQSRLDFSPAILPRYAAAAMLGLLVLVALMVVARRFAGALAYPLEPPALFITGALTAIVAAAIRLGWLLPTSISSPRIDRAVMIATSLGVTTLLACLCLPGTDIFGMSIFCSLLGIEESWAWAWFLRQCSPVVIDHPSPPTPRPSSLVPLSHLAPSTPDAENDVYPEEVTQQLTRLQTAAGADELSGWLRTTFTIGQRTGNIHVAFCPPFAVTPELQVEQLDGPDARIKTAQLLPYGVRLDLKLAATAEEPTNVLLQFSARTAPFDAERE